MQHPVFSGYRPERLGGRSVLLAEPEQAVVDSLYFASRGHLAVPERLDVTGLDPVRLQAWA